MGSAISTTQSLNVTKKTARSTNYVTAKSATFEAQSIANPTTSIGNFNMIISSIESAPASTNIKQSPSKKRLSRRLLNSSMKKQHTDVDFNTLEQNLASKDYGNMEDYALTSPSDLKCLNTKSPTLKRYCKSFAKTQISLCPMPLPSIHQGFDVSSSHEDELQTNCESIVSSFRSNSTSSSSLLSSQQSSPNFSGSMLKRMELDTYIVHKQRIAGSEVRDLKTYHFP